MSAFVGNGDISMLDTVYTSWRVIYYLPFQVPSTSFVFGFWGKIGLV
jgi:hypothetical protein